MAGSSVLTGYAQTPGVANDTIYNPDIIYSPIPRSYEIAGINVEGINHVDDYIIIANSGLSVGERVDVPGDALTNATKRLWRQGLYSKVNITADKMLGDKVWLTIHLRQQPRMSEMKFTGAKGGEKKDITERLGMVPGQQITPNIVARATQIIKDYYGGKGFKNAVVNIRQVPDLSNENQVILDVNID
ncbi:MAG: outer membrane protein assembly factor BamA, partial [Muribaculaceae bacterium]|nr:outer membrane protein assembly factor BamA [Muribaculaceae bacterium]